MRLDSFLYRSSRMAGDLRAIQRGRYPARLGNRYRHRLLVRVLKSWGIW